MVPSCAQLDDRPEGPGGGPGGPAAATAAAANGAGVGWHYRYRYFTELVPIISDSSLVEAFDHFRWVQGTRQGRYCSPGETRPCCSRCVVWTRLCIRSAVPG